MNHAGASAQDIIRTLSYMASSPCRLGDWEAQQVLNRARQVATPEQLRQIESLIKTNQRK